MTKRNFEVLLFFAFCTFFTVTSPQNFWEELEHDLEKKNNKMIEIYLLQVVVDCFTWLLFCSICLFNEFPIWSINDPLNLQNRRFL